MEIEENVPLAPLTTFHIGGGARFFAAAISVDELKQAFDFAREKKLATLVLGGGSNVLIDDAGFDGLVIKIDLRSGFETLEKDNAVEMTAGAGESWDALAQFAVERGLWGIENLSGIPGTVGGAVAGNIGAYGQALSQTCSWVEYLDSTSGEVKRFSNADCKFGYRESVFSQAKNPPTGEMNGSPTPVEGFFAPLIILRAAFALSPAPAPELSYKDLAEKFAGQQSSLALIRETILEIRRGKFPDLNKEGTAGSFFKNPILPRDAAQQLKETYPDMPLFDMPETAGVKIPLAWLLDHALNLRGAKLGGARLYEKQPLVIVAEKKCSASDVRALAEHVQKEVREKLSIIIAPEVKIILQTKR